MIESRKVEFPGATGVMLAARLDLPDEPRVSPCSPIVSPAARTSTLHRGLPGPAARNIAVLRFDFTGIGSSEGEFANTKFSSNVRDLWRQRIPAPEPRSTVLADRP